MCLRKLFPNWFKPDPEPIPDPIPVPGVSKKTALLFAINNYPGSQNDLNGCLNDQMDVVTKLNSSFPGFTIKMFADEQVTIKTFINEITEAISKLIAGDVLFVHYSGHGTQVYDTHGDEDDGYDEAVYLYDGSVIDDDIAYSLRSIPDGATVVLLFDSCFSGTITRVMNNSDHPAKIRFIATDDRPVRSRKIVRIPKSEMKWLVISGCREDQTSADAYINGRYNGAFTFYALKTLIPGLTYMQWIEKIHQYLPNAKFEQYPTIEGKESLFNKIVFT